MLDSHLQYVNKKLRRLVIIYVVLLIGCGYLYITIKDTIAPIAITIIILYFFIASSLRYINYIKWVKKYKTKGSFAILTFKSCPHLFFKSFDGIKVPLKQYALPLDKPIEVVILDSINEITTVIHESTEGEYDVIVSVTHDVHLRPM